MKRRFLPFILLIFVLGQSCSEFNKVLKSNDLDLKEAKAREYYAEGECLKARLIFEELIPLIRGTGKSEEIYFLYAKSIYCDRDYVLAGYYFENFRKTFPNSTYSEEAAFLGALCSVKESPNFSLDQASTNSAIEKLQLFVNEYPETEKRDTINVLVKQLRGKLEKKAFENARIYHQTRRYKSAVIALENTIRNYPDSRYREEMGFLLLDSNYQLAINSVKSKKLERLQNTIDSYHSFADNFSDSESLSRAEQIYESTLKAIKDFNETKE